MSTYNYDQHHQAPPVTAYPPPPQSYPPQGVYVAAPPPMGYPGKGEQGPYSPQRIETQSRGDGFWKGCCAALCCCCVFDACF